MMRCLTLADELRAAGFEPVFISRRLEGDMGEYVQRRGYSVFWIGREEPLHDSDFGWEADVEQTVEILQRFETSPEWLIVDHYGIDHRWEAAVRSFVQRLFIIDDLANRKHVCDFLLDQNAYDRQEDRYRGLVPANCRMLLGPQYLILRTSFYEQRRLFRRRDGQVRKMLVFFGGSDPTNETEKALAALSTLDLKGVETNVIIGAANPNRERIIRTCRQMPRVSLHIQIEEMAERMAEADFALGAGGIAMWERCYLGLPSAVAIVADNQRESVHKAAQSGAVWNLGWHDHTCPEAYADIIRLAFDSPRELIAMGRKAMELTGSRADRTCSRAVAAMLTEERQRVE